MKRFFLILLITILGLVGIGIIFKNPSTNILPKKTAKGVSLTPLSFTENDFLDFLDKTKEAGTIVTWAGDWKELNKPQSAPFVVTGLARQYIGLGNEVNYTFRTSPSQVDMFATVFSASYDAIKQSSPNTRVFTTFQYETPQNALTMAQKFPKADLIAFTSYPEIAGFTNPDKLPPDYYSKIQDKITKPVAFTEIGWRGTNQENQAAFVSKFFDLTKDLKPEFIIWPFLFDQKDTKPFDHIGLFDSKGIPRQSWEVWRKQ